MRQIKLIGAGVKWRRKKNKKIRRSNNYKQRKKINFRLIPCTA